MCETLCISDSLLCIGLEIGSGFFQFGRIHGALLYFGQQGLLFRCCRWRS